MTNGERLEAIEGRLDAILERVPDNPIYEEHESRAVYYYLQSIKILVNKDEKER